MSGTMRSKICLLIFLVLMMGWNATVSADEGDCSSFSECYEDGYYDRAIKLWDERKDSKQSLGYAYFEAGKADYRALITILAERSVNEVIHEFNKAEQLIGGFPELYLWRGYSHLGLNNFKKARSDFKKALKGKPLNKKSREDALLGLSTAYFNTGDKKEAEKILLEIAGGVREGPENINRVLNRIIPAPWAVKKFLDEMGFKTYNHLHIFFLFCLGILLQVPFKMWSKIIKDIASVSISYTKGLITFVVDIFFTFTDRDVLMSVSMFVLGVVTVVVIGAAHLVLIVVLYKFLFFFLIGIFCIKNYGTEFAPVLNRQILLSNTLVFFYSFFATFYTPVLYKNVLLILAMIPSYCVMEISFSSLLLERHWKPLVYFWFLILVASLVLLEFPYETSSLTISNLPFQVQMATPYEIVLTGMVSLYLLFIFLFIFSILYIFSDSFSSTEPIYSDLPIYSYFQDTPLPPVVALLTIVLVGGACLLNYLYKFIPDGTLVYLFIVLTPPVVSLFSKKPKAPKESGT